ncbi:MAG: MFS transporter [Eubacterium sp.]|nr:MFS transporter [Candidatus Colimonas fimequi]
MEKVKNTKKQNTVLMAAMSTAFITSFAGSALTLSVPAMGDYFHLGATSVGWIISIYTIVVAAFSVPMGKIADSTSHRTLLLTGVSIFIITCGLALFCTKGWMIIAVRAIQSLGASMIFATNVPIALSAFPPERRGQTIGIVTSGTYLGLSLGPVLGGIINTHFSWRGVFVFAGLMGAFALFNALRGVDKEPIKTKKFAQDVKGNILYIFMVSCLIYGLTTLNSSKLGWAFMVAGLILAIAFVRAELSVDNPMMDVRLFAENKVFTLSNITAFFHYSTTFALSYLVSIYLQVVMGFSSQIAGFILISQPLFMAVLSPKMGKLSDKVAAYKLVTGGLILSTMTLLFFGFASYHTSMIAVCLFLCMAGVGTALFSSPNTNIVMGCVPPSKFGVTNSLLSAVRTTGQSFSMAVITLVVSMNIGNISLYETEPDQLLKTMHMAFFIFTAMLIAGIFMSVQRGNTQHKGGPKK